jgi:hypothetical protein
LFATNSYSHSGTTHNFKKAIMKTSRLRALMIYSFAILGVLTGAIAMMINALTSSSTASFVFDLAIISVSAYLAFNSGKTLIKHNRFEIYIRRSDLP